MPKISLYIRPNIKIILHISTLALKLFFLAVQEPGAFLSSNLEKALYKSS